MALTARAPTPEDGFKELARVSYGHGYPDLDAWFAPRSEHALFVWQGLMLEPNKRSRLQLPIPPTWIDEAEQPVLRVAWCWDPPVNAATPQTWICRDVELHVRPSNDEKAPALSGVSPRRGKMPYPLRVREFDLKAMRFHGGEGSPPEDGVWTVSVAYSEIAELPDPTYSSYQRIGLCAELVDRGSGASPQAALQTMPLTTTMTRLGVTQSVPVRVRAR